MLVRLYIKNFAIISELEVQLGPGLNIITGETGAGKSIMLDALGLALGQRADSSVMTDPNSKCIVEAEFDVSNLNLEPFFAQHDIDHDSRTIMRREISPGGRSRAFINDSPCKLNQLDELADYLVEVHQQFDQLSIREEHFQRSVLDVLAGQLELIRSFAKEYKEWRKSKQRLEILQNHQAEKLKEKDFLQFQFDELEEANIQIGEEEALNDTLKILSQAEEINQALYQCQIRLNEDDNSISDQIISLSQSLSSFREIGKIQEFQSRLEAMHSELEDLSREAEDIASNIESDPQKLEEADERLAVIFQLKKKHNVQEADQLLEIMQDLSDRLENISSDESELLSLEEKVEQQQQLLQKEAETISKGRRSATKELESRVVERLKMLGMPDARFAVTLSQKSLDASGMDQVQYLFSSNKGIEPTTIKLSASGGEISRLNLAIKSMIAGKLALPTMIFDEIDSGVSGEIARRIGLLLHELGNEHQIVCITHTPQIASLGKHHLHVRKDNTGERTTTTIVSLSKDQRIHEIGQMLGGDPPGEAAMNAARDLLAH